jgi:hypothetical protein
MIMIFTASTYAFTYTSTSTSTSIPIAIIVVNAVVVFFHHFLLLSAMPILPKVSQASSKISPAFRFRFLGLWMPMDRRAPYLLNGHSRMHRRHDGDE